MLDPVVECLREWSGGVHRVSGLVFPDANGQELRQDTVTKTYSKAAERAGRSDLTFHDLRHVATTRLAPLHRDAVHLSKTTGHRDPRSLARYYNPDPIDNAAEIREKAKAAGY
jgi:integrase